MEFPGVGFTALSGSGETLSRLSSSERPGCEQRDGALIWLDLMGELARDKNRAVL